MRCTTCEDEGTVRNNDITMPTYVPCEDCGGHLIPHESVYREPPGAPADDCPLRRAVFRWSDERGCWEMEMWLDGSALSRGGRTWKR